MDLYNATLIESAIEIYDTYFHLVASIFLVVICGVYLWFVLVAGPAWMKNREPYNVIHLIRLYNLFQVFACTVYVTRAQQLGFSLKYIFKCEKFENFSDLVRIEVIIGYWLFLVLRTIEFLETVFFVLRKKQNQASFLHIFHHIGSVAMTWLFIISNAELMAVYIAIINSMVHMVMYTYYFLTSFKNGKLEVICLKVKPFITIMQLVQFGIIIAHCIVAVLPDCNAGYFFHLQIINFIVLTFLFGHFFIQSYCRSKKEDRCSYHSNFPKWLTYRKHFPRIRRQLSKLHRDVTTLNLPVLFSTAFLLIVIFAVYMWFIYIYGPKMMKSKRPYKLKNFIRGYNIFQMGACLVLVVRSYQLGFDFRFLWRCEDFSWLSESALNEIVIGTWFFLFLRMFEFIETVFFILRKKENQASFLHVYHHVSTVILMWVYLTYDTELMALYNASINSFIHVIMYGYYFLSSYKGTRECLSFVKPIITIMQLVQFVLIMGHCIIAILPTCYASGIFFHLQIANLCMLTILFSHFFITNYLKKKDSPARL
ncbi:CLUMA_CG001034, isoform A [Clunio marinus]|uniref:Elongation of very long chain fatty acids protein n=1 Tax=Clunio marinus TaxID=568069 RepID=A0A1J1HLA5_9DIPT|nr:CLUMA_CG001034, isoform A [Clunio marinus]